MKKVLSILLALIICASAVSIAVFATGKEIVIEAIPSAGNIGIGKTFTVDVKASTNGGFNTLAIDVGYDAEVLELVCSNHDDDKSCTGSRSPVVNQLSQSPDGVANSATNSKFHTANPYKMMWAFGIAEENVEGEQLLGTLTFKVKEGALIGKTDISVHIQEASYLDSETLETVPYSMSQFTDCITRVTVECLSHVAGEPETTPAGCDTEGKTVVKCTSCNGVISEETIPATGHTYGDYVVTKPAECGVDGEETATCVTCGATDVKAIPALEHTYGDYVETVAPGCETEGEATATCTTCGATNKKVVDAKGHDNAAFEETVAPGCETEGEEISTCTVCGKEVKKTIPAKGHNCTEYTVTVKATCETAGEETATCTVCGKIDTKVIPATGHNFDRTNAVVIKEPSCVEKGEKAYKCQNSDCDKTEFAEEIPANGHTWVDLSIITPATCVTDGEKTCICNVVGCDATNKEIIPATGHSWNEGEVTKEATLDASGVITHKCTVEGCDAIKTIEIPKLTNTIEGDKLVFVGTNNEASSSAGFKIESADNKPFSGTVSGAINEKTVGKNDKTVNDLYKVLSYTVELKDSGVPVDGDKEITITLPISKATKEAYKDLTLVGVDENGKEVLLSKASLVNDSFVVSGQYKTLKTIIVAGKKIVTENNNSSNTTTDSDKNDKDETVTSNTSSQKDKTTSTASKTDTSSKNSPKTGETATVVIVFAVLVAAAVAIFFTTKKIRA